MSQIGLKKEYDHQENPIVYDWVRQLMSMSALPAFAIRQAWDWWLRFPPATGSSATDVKLQELAEYFDRTWVRGDFPPELWSHFDHNGPRTTNVAEGWHNSLNTHFGTPHPSRVPALAAEMPVRGTKSVHSTRSWSATQTAVGQLCDRQPPTVGRQGPVRHGHRPYLRDSCNRRQCHIPVESLVPLCY